MNLRIADFEHGPHPPAVRALLALCGALALWAVVALAWTMPVPGTWFQPGAFAGALMAGLAAWCFRRSRPLGLALAVLLAAFGLACHLLAVALGMHGLRGLAFGLLAISVLGALLAVRGAFAVALAGLVLAPGWALLRLCRRLGFAA